MKRLAAGFALLLAGCNQGATVTKSGESSLTVTSARAGAAIDAKDCAHAAHAPIYQGAKIISCVSGSMTEGQKRGSIIYTSAAAPGTVLAWYRGEAEKAGLKVALQTDMSLSASEGNRKLMVMAMMQGPENQVTVNWSE